MALLLCGLHVSVLSPPPPRCFCSLFIISMCVYVYVHISPFLPECACTTIIDTSLWIFSCVSIKIVSCICVPGALIWLINLFHFTFTLGPWSCVFRRIPDKNDHCVFTRGSRGEVMIFLKKKKMSKYFLNTPKNFTTNVNNVSLCYFYCFLEAILIFLFMTKMVDKLLFPVTMKKCFSIVNTEALLFYSILPHFYC